MSIYIILSIIVLLGGLVTLYLYNSRMTRQLNHSLMLLDQNRQLTAQTLDVSHRDFSTDATLQADNKRLARWVEMLFEAFPIPLMYADKSGLLFHANDKAKEVYQLQTFEGKLLPFNVMFMESSFHSVINPQSLHEPLYFCEIVQDVKTGQKRYAEKGFIPVKDQQGNVINVLYKERDVTEERASERRLAEEERHVDEVYQHMREIGGEIEVLFRDHDIYMYTSDWANRQLKFYDNPTEPFLEMGYDEFIDCMVGVDHAYMRAHEDFFIDKFREPYTSTFVVQGLFDPNDPKPHIIRHNSRPMFNQEGRAVGAYGVYVDITEEEEKKAQLKHEQERADMSAKQQSIFLSSMSHEIRTPLNGIVGFSQILPMMETKEERQEILDLIQSSCDSMTRLFDDIQDADTVGKTISILPKEVDFSKEFGNVCIMLSLRVTEPGVEYIVENPLSSLILNLDMGRIGQVIANFLTNAVKYTHQGHIKLGYTYSDAEGLYVFCEDTGTGIPKEKQASAFEQFVKLNDNVQGTGLGLNICKKIVEKSGGVIGLDSEEGKGCNFWFRLPTSAIRS